MSGAGEMAAGGGGGGARRSERLRASVEGALGGGSADVPAAAPLGGGKASRKRPRSEEAEEGAEGGGAEAEEAGGEAEEAGGEVGVGWGAEAGGASSSSSSSSSSSAAAPAFRGPVADSRVGELLVDAISIASSVGFALEVSHCRALCGETWRRGVRRADGTLDEAGFKGGTADMMVQSLRLQVPWAEAARKKGREDVQVEGYALQHSTTQLMRAAIRGDVVHVRQLVQLGAPLDLVDGQVGSALHWACFRGHAAVAEALLDGKFEGRGAAIDLQRAGGWTPLIGASFRGHEGVVRLLLARGANEALRGGWGDKTALGWAKEYGRAAVVALLEAAGAPG